MDHTTLKYAAHPTSVVLFRLTALDGPERGRVIDVPVTESRVLVGTSAACHVQLNDRHVSRRHMAIGSVGDRLEVHDLGSSNGTIVNGVVVRECALRGGEVVQLGSSTYRVDAVGSLPAADEYKLPTFGRVIGPSRVMRRVFAASARLAQSNAALVIEGDTGTGKELLAENIHEHSPRSRAPFVVFDPSLVPEHLVSATLFGAEPGALSIGGGTGERAGLFEQAHGGTLLIDGPVDLPLDLQRQLLRAVERGEVQRVGSDRIQRFDVRVITLSQVDLDKAVEEGRIREDLFYRLAAARIELPPLRDRREDVRPLAAHFWHALGGTEGGLPGSLIARFETYNWPGNVRELQNAVASHLATGELLLRDDATSDQPEGDPFETLLALDLPFPKAKEQALRAFEGAYVNRLLAKHGGNVSRAAAASGLAHRYFQVLKARHRR